jgi:hypothetical protein
VQTDLELLLALQAEDVAIHDLDQRLAALEPRMRELDQRERRLTDSIERSAVAVSAEEKRQAYVRDKIAELRDEYVVSREQFVRRLDDERAQHCGRVTLMSWTSKTCRPPSRVGARSTPARSSPTTAATLKRFAISPPTFAAKSNRQSVSRVSST